jgi:hypothetical protein
MNKVLICSAACCLYAFKKTSWKVLLTNLLWKNNVFSLKMYVEKTSKWGLGILLLLRA